MANRKSVIDVLKRMRALLHQGWTQGTYARDKTNRSVVPTSKAAVAWCLFGAKERACAEMDLNVGLHGFVSPCLLPYQSIAGFNDALTTTKKDVIAVMNCAIKKAQEIKRSPGMEH